MDRMREFRTKPAGAFVQLVRIAGVAGVAACSFVAAANDALLAIDQNRASVVEGVIVQWRDSLRQSYGADAPQQEARLREALLQLRADRLLSASLAGDLDGLSHALSDAEASVTLVGSNTPSMLKALGDTTQDLVYTPVTPCRVLDTRGGTVAPYNAPLIGGTVMPVAVNLGSYVTQGGSGTNCGLPLGVKAVVVNIAVLNPNYSAFLSAGDSSNFATLTQSVVMNFAGGQGMANNPSVPVDATGKFYLAMPAQLSTHVTAGVLGYFKAPGGGFVTESCGPGRAIRKVNADGTVICEVTAGSALYQPASRPWVLDLAAVPSAHANNCFAGGFTDGTFAYLVQYAECNANKIGRMFRIRLDTFSVADTTILDWSSVDATAAGYIGGFTDGRYGYAVPYNNNAGNTKHGKLVRVDLQNFAAGGVSIIDLANVNPALVGFFGGFTGGRYGYLVQYADNSGLAGRIARVDLESFAANANSVKFVDLAATDGTLKGFYGGFTDGRYGYVTASAGKLARFELANFPNGAVSVVDLTAIDPTVRSFTGGFTDGHYGYLVPYADAGGGFNNSKFVRVNLANFSASGVSILDLANVDPALKGFNGGFTDGRYAWLAPGLGGTKAARIDLADFSPSGVTAVDFATLDPLLNGFFGGISNGRFGVFVPYYHGPSATGRSQAVRLQLYNTGSAP